MRSPKSKRVKDQEKWLIALVGEHQSLLYAYLRSCGASPSIAADLLQDVFLRIWRQGEERALGENQRAYLLRCVRNAWIDMLRRDQRRREFLLEEEALARAIEERFQDGELDDERLVALADCLSHLNGSARQLVDERYTMGLSNDEIAGARKISVDSVKSTLKRIRAQLRECIAAKLRSFDTVEFKDSQA